MSNYTIKYFSGSIELKSTSIHSMKNQQYAELFPGVKGKKWDSFSKWVGRDDDGNLMPVTRIIEYKKNPSLHKCDARCMGAKGHVCECSCGGKNHGINH